MFAYGRLLGICFSADWRQRRADAAGLRAMTVVPLRWMRQGRVAHRAAGVLFISALTAAMAACTPVSARRVQPGMSQAEVRDRLGAPTLVRPRAGEGEYWYFVSGPVGLTTVRIRFTAGGRVEDASQVLSEDDFNRKVRLRRTTREQLLDEFGPPASVERFERSESEVWVYRYLEASTRMVNNIYIDGSAGVVRRMDMRLDPSELTR